MYIVYVLRRKQMICHAPFDYGQDSGIVALGNLDIYDIVP